jgi:hypothetical protein
MLAEFATNPLKTLFNKIILIFLPGFNPLILPYFFIQPLHCGGRYKMNGGG